MKFSSLCVIFTIALLANHAESFFFRPWGLGLGWRRWDFGLGGLGWGGVPLAVPVPLPVATPVAGAAVLPTAGFGGLVLGKREAANGYGYDHTKPDDSSKMVESESQIESPEKNDHDHKGHSVEDIEHTEEKVFPLHQINQLENNTSVEEFFSGNETESLNSTDSGVVKRAIVVPAVPIPIPVRTAVLTPLVPVARVVPVVRVAPVLRVAPVALLGKRSIVNTSDLAENNTVCRLSTQNSTISCRGVNFNFECDVVANLTFGGFLKKNEDFRVLPNGVESFNLNDSTDAEVRRFEIVSLKDDVSDVNDYTFVHDGQKVILSLHWSENNQEAGFRFREQQCWNTYVDMLRVTGTRNVKLILDIARV